jgi:hypothetical protein
MIGRKGDRAKAAREGLATAGPATKKAAGHIASGPPGSKLIVYELPRPDFRRLALASEGRESKLLFHQRNKKVVAAGTHCYSSRASFRFPQCLSFDGLYSGIGFAPCRASIIPTWACIKGPRSSAAMITASPAACHSGLCCFDMGSARMYAAACFSVMSFLPFGGWIGSSKGRDHGIAVNL